MHKHTYISTHMPMFGWGFFFFFFFFYILPYVSICLQCLNTNVHPRFQFTLIHSLSEYSVQYLHLAFCLLLLHTHTHTHMLLQSGTSDSALLLYVIWPNQADLHRPIKVEVFLFFLVTFLQVK